MTDILDKLDILSKSPSKKSSIEYFLPSLDDIVNEYADMSENERNLMMKLLDSNTIKKIKALQEGGLI